MESVLLGLPVSKVLRIDCPVSSHMRSKVKQQQSDQDLGIDSTTVLPTNLKSSVSNARLQPPTPFAEIKTASAKSYNPPTRYAEVKTAFPNLYMPLTRI